MQDYNVRGTIFRIFSKSNGVFIFVIKTIEQYPISLKAKKFRPKDMDEQAWFDACNAFVEGQIVSLRNCRISTEKSVKDGVEVLTTDGQPVFVPVIIVDFMAVEVASLHYAPKSTPTPDMPAPAPAPSAVQNAPQRIAQPQAAMPAPSPQPVTQPAESNDDNLPHIPF